jgi:hypothetical protein
VTELKWTKVSKQKPPYDKQVLVITDWSNDYGIASISKTDDGDLWFDGDNNLMDGAQPVKWMSLPPKGK